MYPKLTLSKMIKRVLFFIVLLSFFYSCEKDLGKKDEEDKDVYVLPVVIHIIHFGEPIGEGYNLSVEKIEEQIVSLNNDYRRKIGTPGYNESLISDDSRIEFKLAQYDPSGNPTNGITRTNRDDVDVVMPDSNKLDMMDILPQFVYWDPEKYINIWVYPMPDLQDILLGKSTLPYTDLPGIDAMYSKIGDGILINTLHFGFSNIESDANHGRTLTHEMGHFLGLLHLWGENGDFVEDTPPVTGPSYSCNNNRIASSGQPALINNYMDYLPDDCMNMFTIGQIERMHYVLEHAEDRNYLAHSGSINR
jgi:hypothetical protein